MRSILPVDHSRECVRLTTYAAAIGGAGRKFPAHPKMPGVLHIARISAETGIPAAILRTPPVMSHLRRLALRVGVYDAALERRLSSADRIATAYAARPLPARGRGVHTEQLAHGAGIPLADARTAECLAVIERLVAVNGTLRTPPDPRAEIDALQTYEADLVAGGSPVPVNSANGRPAIQIIARAIGIPPGRFAYQPLRAGLETMVARVGLDDVPTIADEVAKLTAFVAAQIAAGRVAPRRGGSIAYAAISREVGIQTKRLRAHAAMTSVITLWNDERPST